MLAGAGVVAAAAGAPRQAAAAWTITPFNEEAALRGVSFQMLASGQMTSLGYLGWGCGIVDLDLDGDPDLLMVGKPDGRVGVFENLGGGFFQDRSLTSGIAPLTKPSGFAVADYDNDGTLDINFTQLADGNRLLRGLGNFTWTNVTAAAGVGDTGAGKGCAWGDFNLDGWLDLFIANYDGIVAGTAGEPDRLYRNNGNGTFTDVAPANGCNATGYGFQPAWTDIDNDGDPDLYLSQDRGHLPPLMQGNRLWRNDNGSLVEISAGSGANVQLFSMGMAVGDWDQNGFVDFYDTNIGSNSGPLAGKNPLLLNQGDNTFVESSVTWGMQGAIAGVTGWCAIFWDFDNNGWLDLFINQQFQADRLWASDGVPPATDVTALAGIGGPTGTGILKFCSAVGDVDGDGDLDLLTNPVGLSAKLYINKEGSERSWAKFDVVGMSHNRFAVGARLDLRIGTQWQRREVLSGSNGYLGQNEIAVHFGLDQATTIDELVVTWPLVLADGLVQRHFYNLPASARWTLYPTTRLGDFDGDGDVDIDDYGALGTCYGSPLLAGFEMMDFDGDSDVDEVDASEFAVRLFGEPLDCDGDGLLDLAEILDEPALDADGDAQLDDCGGDAADLNGDGQVTGADLGLLLANWGQPGVGDLDGSGVVDGADLGILLAAWSA